MVYTLLLVRQHTHTCTTQEYIVCPMSGAVTTQYTCKQNSHYQPPYDRPYTASYSHTHRKIQQQHTAFLQSLKNGVQEHLGMVCRYTQMTLR